MTTKNTRAGRARGEKGVNPASDATRVLGQIERGEVQAGPEGARKIAACHEEAYGDVWSK